MLEQFPTGTLEERGAALRRGVCAVASSPSRSIADGFSPGAPLRFPPETLLRATKWVTKEEYTLMAWEKSARDAAGAAAEDDLNSLVGGPDQEFLLIKACYVALSAPDGRRWGFDRAESAAHWLRCHDGASLPSDRGNIENIFAELNRGEKPLPGRLADFTPEFLERFPTAGPLLVLIMQDVALREGLELRLAPDEDRIVAIPFDAERAQLTEFFNTALKDRAVPTASPSQAVASPSLAVAYPFEATSTFPKPPTSNRKQSSNTTPHAPGVLEAPTQAVDAQGRG